MVEVVEVAVAVVEVTVIVVTVLRTSNELLVPDLP